MAERQTKNSDLVKGTLVYSIGNLGTKILNFLIVPLYTYFIEPEALGDYDLLITTVSLLSPLLTLRISEAAYRWIINDKSRRIECVSASYFLLIRNAIIAALAILCINHFIPIWNCHYFIAILICDRLLECTQKILRGFKNQKLFAVSGLFHTAIFVGLNFVRIVILHEGVEAILQSTIISGICTLLLIFTLEKRLRESIHFGDYRFITREMLKYSFPLVPSALAWWVMSASDRYVIRFLLGAVSNGIYAVAYKFPTILQTFFTMFNNAWTDMALSRMGNDAESKKYASDLFENVYLLSFQACFVLIPATKLFANNLLGSSYQISSIYIGFLYVATVFQGLSSFCSIGYLQDKKTKGAALTSLYGAIVNLIIDILLMKYIGLFAASISTLVGFFVMWLVRMHDTKESFPIAINKIKFSLNFLVSLILATLSIWTTNIIDLILFVAAACFFVGANRTKICTILSKLMNKLKHTAH